MVAEIGQPDNQGLGTPATPPLPETEADYSDSGTGFTWQASEYLFKKKGVAWHIWLVAGVAGLIAVAVLTHQFLTVGVFAAMFGALVVYGNKPPRTLTYTLDDSGVTIEEKFYPYNQFKSFSVLQDEGWHTVDLEPARRFMPRLSILFEDNNREAVVGILTQFLPRQDREPDLIDRVARKLKF